MKDAKIMPSSLYIIKEAEKANPRLDINALHAKTYEILKRYRDKYYKKRVRELLSGQELGDLPEKLKSKIENELLRSIIVEDKEYSNFMEEVSRRISQVFQVVSGNIAELCVERELIKADLKLGIHYDKKRDRTDFIIYYPEKDKSRKRHRIEVKNVKLRERGTRGLAFDGDSMIGFFNQPDEFSESNVKIIEEHCNRMGGSCYVPPETLRLIKYKSSKFKSNTKIGKDMKKFVETGVI